MIQTRRRAPAPRVSRPLALTRTAAIAVLALLAACRSAEPALAPFPSPDLSLLDRGARFPIDQRDQLAATASDRRGAPEKRAAAHGELGMLYHAFDLTDAALTCYANAQTLDADDYRWPYLASVLSRDSGRDDRAEALLRAALALNGQYAPVHTALGEIALDSARAEEARAFFENALALDPDQPAALAGLGLAAQNDGRHEDAVAYCLRALARDPAATALHYRLALLYRKLGDAEASQRHMALRGDGRPALADPLLNEVKAMRQDAEGLRRRGDDAAQAKRFAEAAVHYQAALALDPDDARLWHNLGWAQRQSGDLAGAARAFAETLARNQGPTLNAAAHYWLGDIAERSSRSDAGQYAAAVAANPNHLGARFRLAENLRLAGRCDEAQIHYRQAIAINPGWAEPRLGRALCLIRAQRWRQAQTALAEDTAAVPDQPAFVHMQARLWAASPENALRDGQTALDAATRLAATMDNDDLAATRAMALAELGQYDAAVQAQTRAIAMALEAGNPTDALQRDLLAYRDGKPCRRPWPTDDPLFFRKLY